MVSCATRSLWSSLAANDFCLMNVDILKILDAIMDWIGLDWIGLDWIGLDWIGLDWIGLDLD